MSNILKALLSEDNEQTTYGIYFKDSGEPLLKYNSIPELKAGYTNLTKKYPDREFIIKKTTCSTIQIGTPELLESVEEISEEQLDENLRKWFKEKWVRFGPDGKIRGACARGSESEGKPKCLPQAKAHALGKKGRKYAAAKKRREDPNPDRHGPAKNVATKKKTNEGVDNSNGKLLPHDIANTLLTIKPEIFKRFGEDLIMDLIDKSIKSNPNGNPFEIMAAVLGKLTQAIKKGVAEEQLDELKCWPSYTRVQGVPAGAPGSCKKKTNEEHQQCPECGGAMYSEELINEKKDACYYKVKSRYKVWPSAYASGALVKCRKKGAKNWGTKSESAILKGIQTESFGLNYPTTYERETDSSKKSGQRRTSTLTTEEELDEKWSAKYKRSIDCNHPKGFSQRAHCQGRKK